MATKDYKKPSKAKMKTPKSKVRRKISPTARSGKKK